MDRSFFQVLLGATLLLCSSLGNVEGTSLLVGNTRADNIVEIQLDDGGDPMSSMSFMEEIRNPDHMVVHNDHLFVSSGDDLESSAIYGRDDDGMPSVFATGGDMVRPYGFAFYEDTLYVASFKTDQILMFDATTGEYKGVFASKEDTYCNGPNHIAIHDGTLYLTTQGSNFVNGTLQYMFAR